MYGGVVQQVVTALGCKTSRKRLQS